MGWKSNEARTQTVFKMTNNVPVASRFAFAAEWVLGRGLVKDKVDPRTRKKIHIFSGGAKQLQVCKENMAYYGQEA